MIKKCEVCGQHEGKIERIAFTDASGNSDYKYIHIGKCPPKTSGHQ